MRTRRNTPPNHKPEPMITSVSLRDFCCLEHALKAVERAWGVRLVVGVQLNITDVATWPLDLTVRCIEQVHTEELNGFLGISTGMFNTDLVPFEIQAVSAVLEWVCRLEEHMAT